MTNCKHNYQSLQIVSSFTHLSGHYLPYTLDLARALSSANENLKIKVHAARTDHMTGELSKSITSWKACASWAIYYISKSYRNKHWGGLLDRLLRNLEFHCCLRSALRESQSSPNKSHIHCIEACHRILLRNVLRRPEQTFSTLCVGSPASSMNPKRAQAYREAFETKRLTFIVETEAVRAAWEPYAGEHVVHVPAAIPGNNHESIASKEARSRLGLPQNEFICLFFGTHREGKDYRTAIKAARLSTSKPFLLFVGPLISENDPSQLLQEMNYTNAASWEGYYPDEKIGELFDACDVVMLPYSEGYDKGSAVLLQACQYLKPVIATNTGYLAEFVNKHHIGLLFESEDSKSLAAFYDQFTTSSARDSELLKASIEATRDNFRWEKLISSYQKIFQLRVSDGDSQTNNYSCT